MATADQIPSDLTLEIGVDLSPERFMAATRAFFGYIEEIGRMTAPDGVAPDWVVRVREGSSLIGLDPAPATPIAVVRAVYARAQSGVSALAHGDIESAALPDAALKHLRTLSDLMGANRGAPAAMRIWVERKPIVLSPEIAETIKEDWRIDYRDYGTIEGRLEAIQDYSGLELRVRDLALRLIVKCYVPEDMLDEAFRHFRKRVEVAGLIHFRRNGIPISIDVTRIEELPDDNSLPSIEEVRGIMRLSA
jgi:hypothetical protein